MAYVGNVTATLDGIELEVQSLEVRQSNIRKTVTTMKKKGSVLLSGNGTGSMSVLLDKVAEEPDWENIEDSTLSYFPKDGGGKQTILTGFAVEEVSESYSTDNEAKRDITFSFQNKSTK